MANQQLNIVSEILAYIAGWGGAYSQWYAGISSDARERLFKGHLVKEQGDGWIFRRCETSQIARAIEDHLINLGLSGGPGGGDAGCCYVYAYKIGSHTAE